MAEWHTRSDSQASGQLMMVIRGTRLYGIPYDDEPPPLSTAYTHRRSHDYTYGLSRPSLRPVVIDDEPIKGWSGPPVRPAPKPAKKRKRRIHRVVEAIQPAIYTEPGVYTPDDEDLGEVGDTPWWLDEKVLVSRNEEMLSDLLEDSQ